MYIQVNVQEIGAHKIYCKAAYKLMTEKVFRKKNKSGVVTILLYVSKQRR